MAEQTVLQKTGDNKPDVAATREETRFLRPPVDIYETKDELVVLADLPGVAKDDVDVRVENNILTINGKTSHEMPGAMLDNEFTLYNYYRQFELSDTVDQEKIQAELKHGVLTIHLPKAAQVKPKQIEVKVS